MTVPVRVAARALDWINREAESLGEHEPAAAERFRGIIGDAMQQLAEHPRSGKLGILPDARILVKADYLISYRLAFARDGVTVQAVEIFAVRHGRQRDARAPSM